MGLDKVKHNLHIGSGIGPADTHAANDVPETSGLEEGAAREGGGNPARGLRGRGNGPDNKHARVQDVLQEGKQKVQQLLERTGDAPGRGGRLTRGEEETPPGQAKKRQDGGHTDLRETGRAESSDSGRTEARDARTSHVPSSGNGEHGRSHETQNQNQTDRSGHAQGFGRGDEDHGRSNFRPSSNAPNGNANGHDSSHGRGPLDSHGHGRGALNLADAAPGLSNDARGNLSLPSVVAYLRGEADGAHLPRELRQVLDGTSRLLGSDLVAALERRGPSDDGHAVKILEHALARVARTLGRVAEAGGAAASNVTPRVFDEAVGELLAATMLDKYFRRAEATGGRVVAQAEAALARLLYGEGRGEGGGRLPGVYELPRRPGPDLPAPHPLEVLRDLQAGAFRPVEVSRSPFPLSGRALVATEMMEMMRTLDAVDLVTRELLAAARGGASTVPSLGVGGGEEAPLLALLRVLAGTAGGADVLDELLSLLPPALPGRAARLEIPRLVAALGGVLTDAEGRAFVTKDGVPLRLDQLMWMGSLGGVLKSLAGAGAESFPVRLSPLLIYGFDAVYSLIGFDGRTLNPPHFAAVQAQVNGSEMEWVYGQPPLSEGWMRALIERLKDSAQADHNLLGEMLEEALADGRFHAALVGGTVSEGEARPDTFAVTRLLPATA
ncbi:MAG TPA: hypothetical protein VF591_04860 [Pyrinomonadaceae bacterium]|jgi:hypothetical protein